MEYEEGGKGFFTQVGQLAHDRNSFYEQNKHEISAGINPEYKEYRELVKVVREASRPIRDLRDPIEKFAEFIFPFLK